MIMHFPIDLRSMHCHKINIFQGGISESAENQVHTIDYLFIYRTLKSKQEPL